MRTIILPLIITACLLLTGCGGGGGSSGGSSSPEPLSNTTADGGGDGNNGGGGGNGNGSNGDGGGERPSLPADVELSISPFIDGLRIQWHNLSAIEGAGGIYIHLNLTDNITSSQPIREKIVIEDLTDNSSEIDGLDNGIAYRLVEVRVELADNISWVIDNITWSEPWEAKTNALDNNGGGIVVGANHDGDGRADGVDEDDDNDGRPNSMDDCRLGEIGWLSTNRTLDYDSDGCRDRDEDWDNDNDGVNNTRADGTTVWDLCSAREMGELHWQSNSTSDYDGDGCRDRDEDWDNDNDGVNNTRADGTTIWDLCSAREMGELHWQSNSTSDYDRDGCRDAGEDRDDDNDGVDDSEDSCPVGQSNWNNDGTNDFDGDGCRNDEDPDGDNDGVLNVDEEIGCELKIDCDDDGVDDINEVMGCAMNPNCDGDGEPDNRDIDDDGDGLIEIRNASELDAVRYVLDGTGFKTNEGAMLDQTGCGDGTMTACNGYELVRDISLTDYIAERYSMEGWPPIAPDATPNNNICDGNRFTGIFDGNGFEVRGLFINRSMDDCIALFSQTASGVILNLGVVVDRIIGKAGVGGLVGYSFDTTIIQSYVVSDSIRGSGSVGGLVGWPQSTKIVQSYAINGEVYGSGQYIGGLVGGNNGDNEIIQSYAVSNSVSGGGNIGGLVGNNPSSSIVQSYAVSGMVTGGSFVGGLMGLFDPNTNDRASYWDTETSGILSRGAGSGQPTSALRSPTDYTGIYDEWDDGAMVDGINVNTTIWCDEDASGIIEDDEMRNSGDEDNRVWDFGTSSDYPALRCTGDSLTDQRAWWHLNATHKPELDQDRLDAYLNGTLP